MIGFGLFACKGSSKIDSLTSDKVADPSRLSVGALFPSIASDGTNVISVSVNDLTGKPLVSNNLSVEFSSRCQKEGTTDLDASVLLTHGSARASYLPHDCLGNDTVTAKVVLDGAIFESSVTFSVGSSRALSAKATLGKSMFFDKALSASFQQSCASCHSPANAYYSTDALSVPLGGTTMQASGFRSTPTAAYAALIPPFGFLPVTNQQGSVDNIANGKLGTPRRGLMWDGRARDVKAQASGPFTGPHEMANANNQEVLGRLLSRPYIQDFRAVYGSVTATSNADTVVGFMAEAIALYETENASFAPFSSKFDAVIAGKAQFTAQELNGRSIFNNSKKAACLGCHDSTGQSINDPQLFTDLSYRAIGVPRNWDIPYNNDHLVSASLQNIGLSSLANGASLGEPNHLYYDLGFCGPFRTDSSTDTALCGAFRVAPLRNVALKGSYFHNGVFKNLKEVILFYVNRDINPGVVYKKADGTADIHLNDLPLIYQSNVDQTRAPFQPLANGVRLTDDEVNDLIAFLCTLTDGFDPANPNQYPLPGQCREIVR